MADPWAQFVTSPGPTVPPVAADPGTVGAAPTADPWAQYVAPAAPAAPPLDQYQQAAADKLAKLKASGQDPSYGAAEQFINGRMLGALPTVMAALTTPASMIEQGTFDPTVGYDYAKAQQNALLASGNAEQPITNTLANLGGGVMTGAGAAKAGLTMVPAAATGAAAPGILATAGGMAADGAAYGAASGALSGEGSGRLTGALEGGAIGGAAGAALPLGAKLIGTLASPIVSGIASRVDPEASAAASLARAMNESGKTPEQLQAALDNATAAGQPNFALADALGKSGQDMLSNVVRSPGDGATTAADFLQNRQTNQGRSLAAILSDGLDAPQTAAQTTAGLTAQRTADAATNYGAARAGENAGAVDVTPAIAIADQTLLPGVTKLVNPNSNIADNSVESAVRKAKGLLTDGTSNLSDFSQVLRAKVEIGNLIESGTPSQQQELIPIKNALDAELVKASPAYANARDTFAAQSKAIDAVPMGENAQMRGRPEDTIPAYNGLSPAAQSAYRVGYSDPLMEALSSAAPGVNKARQFLNDGTQAELGNMSQFQGPVAPGQKGQLAQNIARENTMFETAARATGGSKTFDNMQAEKGMKLDPGLILDAFTGSPQGLLMAAARKGANALTGSTPAVRSKLGDMLMMRGPNADVGAAVNAPLASIASRARLARMIAAGTFGGTADATSGQENGRLTR